MDEQAIIQDFENLFGAATPPSEPPVNDPEPPAAPPAEPPVVPEGEPDVDPPAAPPAGEPAKPVAPEEKANHAIAKLRVEKTAYENAIKSIGAKLNLDPAMPLEEMAAKIEEAAVLSQAKELGLSPEVAQKLNLVDRLLEENQQNQRYLSASNQLNGIQEKFKVDGPALQQFVDVLVSEGLNPLQVDIDLETEYIKRNWTTVSDFISTQAAAAERERLKNASSAPAAPIGGAPGEPPDPDEVNTIDGLSAFLDSQLK